MSRCEWRWTVGGVCGSHVLKKRLRARASTGMEVMTGLISRWPICAIATSVVVLAGCSTHPIPDDVSRYSTEDIVRNVRCEAKEAVRERIQLHLLEVGLTGMDPERVLADKRNFETIKRTDPKLAAKFHAYGMSTISYKFSFKITEDNNMNNGNLKFVSPFTGGEFSLVLGGSLEKQRYGDRAFKTLETFGELVNLDCRNWSRPGRNIAYPLTGSIGVGRIINTFIDLSELGGVGGGKEMFTDTITFTTFVSGKVTPTLELTPVGHRFQLAKASAEFENKRNDVHEVIVSLAFPDLKEVEAMGALGAGSTARLIQEAKDKSLINLCIADGEAREDRFGTLRDISPKDYCRRNGPFAPW
jgi:hypothetical protein